MRFAVMFTPLTDHQLRLAAQVGATDIVAHYPGLDLDHLLRLRDRIESFGLRLSVIERLIPHDKVIHNRPGRDEQIEGYKTLIRNMGKAGVEVLCYNWMPEDDWQRTAVDVKERGGALVTEFDVDKDPVPPKDPKDVTSEKQLWENLQYFLEQVVPVAEKAGVKLALHPDDPPMPILRNQPRIIINHEAYERVVDMVPSEVNGVCYCQGTFASAGLDMPAGIRRLAKHIFFAHIRDVVGGPSRFRETFHDNGKTNLVETMRAWHEIGFTGPMRPDHVPTLDGETNENPGYETLGRLYAIGYLRGLYQATGNLSQTAATAAQANTAAV